MLTADGTAVISLP